MMTKNGKKYNCEYCEKRFKDDPNIRKKHIDRLPHQNAREEHYAHFKSLKEILEAEKKKKPCGKFPSGTCQFGATCRFNHHTSKQLAKIREQAHLEDELQLEKSQPKKYSKKMIEDFVTRKRTEKEQSELKILKEFFNYPNDWLKIQHQLPPSLRLIDPSTLKKDINPTFFG